jgi:hypothetical protein
MRSREISYLDVVFGALVAMIVNEVAIDLSETIVKALIRALT